MPQQLRIPLCQCACSTYLCGMVTDVDRCLSKPQAIVLNAFPYFGHFNHHIYPVAELCIRIRYSYTNWSQLLYALTQVMSCLRLNLSPVPFKFIS